MASVSALNVLLGKLQARSLELDRYLLRAKSDTEKLSLLLERSLWAIISASLDRLSTNEAGIITDTATNYNLILPLASTLDRWITQQAAPSILTHMAKKVQGITTQNTGYFKLIQNDPAKLQRAMQRGSMRVYNALGIYTADQIKSVPAADFYSAGNGLFVLKDSRLDGLSMLTGTTTTGTLRTEITGILNNAISTRANFFDTKKRFEELAGVNPDVNGKVAGYLNTAAFDTLNAQARHEHELVSGELGMNWFLYLGGLRKTSRQFCRDKAGKLFHRLDAKEWENQNFAGKITKGYVGIIHLGGYHCYHRTGFVPDEVAKMLDPDKYADPKYQNYQP